MNIRIISVGKIKEKYIREGLKEFQKRLSSYCRLDIIEIPDQPTPDRASSKDEERIKNIEGEKILSKIENDAYIISLVIQGKNFSSEDLAKKLDDLALDGRSKVNFIIGGSLGLSDEVISRSDLKLSFSKMTFPHQLMRLILLEQIYRSFRIIKGEPYHK